MGPRSRIATTFGTALLAGLILGACGGDEVVLTPTEQARQTVVEGLRSDHEWLRAETIRLIAELGTTDFRSDVEAALSDPSPVVQTAAIEALLRLGDRSVESQALARLVSGTPEQRLRLLELIVDTGRAEFRAEVLLRALRDTSGAVQRAALAHAVATETPVAFDELNRLINGTDEEVASEAFRTLVHFERVTALDLVLDLLRSNTQTERDRGLRFARHLNSANLWPLMRSLAAQSEDPDSRRRALLVLGHLGDRIAEEPLRDMVLSARDEVAAEALTALSHIDTAAARNQPLTHRSDARAPVRDAALSALIRQRRPADDFETYLDDRDPEIAERALIYMQDVDPERAAAIYSQTLRDTEEPYVVLYALYRVSLRHDIRRFLDACSNQLRAYLNQPDAALSGLAARLLLTATSPAEMEDAIVRAGTSDALYALVEASYGANGDFSSLYTDALNHDLYAVRVAAALGIVSLGDAYRPPATEEDS